MKKIISLLIPIVLISGVIEDFQKGKYREICSFKVYEKHRDDYKILNLIGLACVKADRLFFLPLISFRLRENKVSRKNSIYFLTLVLQKRLLYSYFFDGNKDLFYFSFPKTDYFLSDIFNAIKNKNFIKLDNIYIIKIKNYVYKVFKNKNFLEIDEYKNNKFVKRHLFK